MISNYPEGYCVVHNAVPHDVVQQYRRLFLLEIVNWGLTKDQFDQWHHTKAWFPTLREHVKPLVDYIPSGFRMGTLCEPQILLHFPDEAEEWLIEPHLDEEPSWANGQKYSVIAGVALSEQSFLNGGLVSHGLYIPSTKEHTKVIEMNAGDVVVFNPKLWHSSGLNHSGDIRMMVYFRWLNNGN